MIKEKRLQLIESFLLQNSTASFHELVNILHVSENTIRRDLEDLNKMGIAHKVRGGAKLSIDTSQVPSYYTRSTIKPKEKAAIGKHAAQYVKQNSVIYIDPGTTTLQIIPYIPKDYRVTIITSNRGAINSAVANRNIHIVCLGGEYYPDSDAFVGLETIKEISNHGIETAFLGTNGINTHQGLTNASKIEAEVKRIVISIAQQKILMADSSKFNRVSYSRFADLYDIDILITEQIPPKDLYDALIKAHVDIQYAQLSV